MHALTANRQSLPVNLVALFLSAATLANVEASAAPSRAPAPAPRPAPAPAPRPAPAPAPRPAPAPAPKPSPVSAAPAPVPKPASSFAKPTPAYKSVTMNAPAAVPSTRNALRPGAVTDGQAVAAARQAPAAGTQAPERSRAGAQAARAKPSLEGVGLANGVSSRLAPQVRQFEDRYRNVQVVKQPTTSGWTWLFLAWALYNSGEDNRLESDNAAIKARMAELEKQLRDDPVEWGQLQELAAQQPATQPGAASAAVSGASATLAATNMAAGPADEALETPSHIAPDTPMPAPNWWALVAVIVTGAACAYTLFMGRKSSKA